MKKGQLKLVSWNVNGIRACINKGFFDWLDKDSPHVVCVQETKIQQDQWDQLIEAPENYSVHLAQAQKRGYSGVGFFIHKSLAVKEVEIGLGIPKFDDEGRTLIAYFDKFVLINGYFPNGQRDHGRVPYKLDYSRAVAQRAQEIENELDLPVIIAGDYNTAHKEIDLKNPKENKKTTGFLPIEREWIDEFIESGYRDIFRDLHPEEEGHYTWWTYRGNCRARNVGWRIDYFFTPENFSKKVLDAYHLPQVMGSDHCPTVIEVKI